jgi:heme-degrading monooxygenase HmoA
MRTTDFSKAPPVARGTAIFFGGTRYSGLRSILRLILVWRRVSRTMKKARGYRGHYVWYRFPFSFGTISVWDSHEDLLEFARTREHREAVTWLYQPGTARGSFIRYYDARPEGHSIGEWRAEGD